MTLPCCKCEDTMQPVVNVILTKMGECENGSKGCSFWQNVVWRTRAHAIDVFARIQ
jgi:hypothetical protein